MPGGGVFDQCTWLGSWRALGAPADLMTAQVIGGMNDRLPALCHIIAV
jgi:hypothetical protein